MSTNDREATVREIRRAIHDVYVRSDFSLYPNTAAPRSAQATQEALFGILALVNDLADDLQHVRAMS